MNGAPASRASRREISVLPTPVGPIIRMFFGSTSSRSEPVSCSRRQRLRSAIATARLASAWPTMKRSSSDTISRGEKSVIVAYHQKCGAALRRDHPIPAKAGLFIGPDRPGIGRIGIGDDTRRSHCEQVSDKRANESRTMAAIEHARFADELVDG